MPIPKLYEIYHECFEFAKAILYLPNGEPRLIIERYPSAHFTSEEISAVSDFVANNIFVNLQWAEKCLTSNIVEYEFIIYHELRHFHQQAAIDHYKTTGELKGDTQGEIARWEKEFGNYIVNYGDDESRKANAAQMCERDANAYGVILVNLFNIDNSMSVNLRLPEITGDDVYRYEREKPGVRRLLEKYKGATFESLAAKQSTVKKLEKIGRNALCPCGSGLKYKKCSCSQYH